MSKDKKNIRLLTLDELKDFFTENNQATFRGKQVYEWLWKKSVHSFDKMNNLPQSVRELLEANFVINHAIISEEQKSADRTIKSAFKLFDNNNVEGVLIPTKKKSYCLYLLASRLQLNMRFLCDRKIRQIEKSN